MMSFSIQLQAFLAAVGVDRQTVRELLSQPWQFPRHRAVKSKELRRIFDERRVASREPDKIKASCSELLGAYGLLLHLAECDVPRTAKTEATLL